MCWNWSPHGHAGFESKVLLASFSVEVKVKAHDNCLLILASMHHNPFSYMMHICRNYIERWVINGKAAKLRTEATAPHLSFDQQCIHCEKVNSNCYFWMSNELMLARFLSWRRSSRLQWSLSADLYASYMNPLILQESVTQSLNNLLTYPWIKERVEEGLLSISGGYYDFADCTFEKWTLDIERSGATAGKRYSTKDHQFWCWDIFCNVSWKLQCAMPSVCKCTM